MLAMARVWRSMAEQVERSERDREVELKKPSPKPTDTYVGNKLRSLRQERGLSQTQVGEALGVTFQQIQKYERGANRISASKLHQLAQVLKVSPEHFFEGLEQKDNLIGLPARDYEKELSGNSEALALMNAFNRISNRTLRRSIISMVTELAGPEEDAGTTD